MTAVDGLLLTADETEWLDVRERLVRDRHALGVAAADEYEDAVRVAGTPLLTQRRWTPARPLPLDAVELRFQDSLLPVEPLAGVPGGTLPTRVDGTRYPSYSAAMADLAPPRVFENRPTYRLLDADLARPRGELVFGLGWYFDSIDTGEAAAHEYAAGAFRRLRDAVGDPCDLERRPANLGLSVLTLRVEDDGGSTFLLHWRDPAKVGHAGGLHQVLPVGVFQPAVDEHADLSLWRCMVREYAEELLGASEDETAVDFDAWPFATAMTDALRSGDVTASVVGLGVDPLTFATDLLVVCEIRRAAFDELFGGLVGDNDEGRIHPEPLPFDAETVRRCSTDQPMQAAGAAVLRVAHRMLRG